MSLSRWITGSHQRRYSKPLRGEKINQWL
jgi:hypothetical protein